MRGSSSYFDLASPGTLDLALDLLKDVGTAPMLPYFELLSAFSDLKALKPGGCCFET